VTHCSKPATVCTRQAPHPGTTGFASSARLRVDRVLAPYRRLAIDFFPEATGSGRLFIWAAAHILIGREPHFARGGRGAGAGKRRVAGKAGSRSTRPRWCATAEKMGLASLRPDPSPARRERPAQMGSVARRGSECIPITIYRRGRPAKFLARRRRVSPPADAEIAFLNKPEITGDVDCCRH
jgi:hypothetical protein